MKVMYLRAGKTAGYLKTFDPDAHDGRGAVKLTTRKDEALRFATATECMALWLTPSKTFPRRPDGKPNRPLSAFTSEIIDADAVPMLMQSYEEQA